MFDDAADDTMFGDNAIAFLFTCTPSILSTYGAPGIAEIDSKEYRVTKRHEVG